MLLLWKARRRDPDHPRDQLPRLYGIRAICRDYSYPSTSSTFFFTHPQPPWILWYARGRQCGRPTVRLDSLVC